MTRLKKRPSPESRSTLLNPSLLTVIRKLRQKKIKAESEAKSKFVFGASDTEDIRRLTKELQAKYNLPSEELIAAYQGMLWRLPPKPIDIFVTKNYLCLDYEAIPFSSFIRITREIGTGIDGIQ